MYNMEALLSVCSTWGMGAQSETGGLRDDQKGVSATLALPGHLLAIKQTTRSNFSSSLCVCVFVSIIVVRICLCMTTTTRHNYYTPLPPTLFCFN